MKKNDKIYKVYEMVCEGTYTREEIREAVGGSTRTFWNYIDQIPKGYAKKLPAGQKAPIYHYPGMKPPPFKIGSRNLDAKHVSALRLAEAAFRQVLKIPEAVVIAEAVQISLQNAIDVESSHPAYKKAMEDFKEQSDYSGVVYFAPTSMSEPIKENIWEPLLRACKERKMVEAKYTSGWKGTEERIIIYPLLIANLEDDWHLLAAKAGKLPIFCPDDRRRHQAPPNYRQYNLSRFEYVKRTETDFRPPQDFDAISIMNRTFGAFIGDPNKIEDITLEFCERVEPLLKKRHFHLCQKTKRQNGKITLTFPATSAASENKEEWKFYHVRKWILQWGYDCRVISPPELVELVKQDIDKMRKIYSIDSEAQ